MVLIEGAVVIVVGVCAHAANATTIIKLAVSIAITFFISSPFFVYW
jgi:hypothetical protein